MITVIQHIVSIKNLNTSGAIHHRVRSFYGDLFTSSAAIYVASSYSFVYKNNQDQNIPRR